MTQNILINKNKIFTNCYNIVIYSQSQYESVKLMTKKKKKKKILLYYFHIDFNLVFLFLIFYIYLF